MDEEVSSNDIGGMTSAVENYFFEALSEGMHGSVVRNALGNDELSLDDFDFHVDGYSFEMDQLLQL